MSPEAQIITADPDVTCHEITEEDEFLVIACDGQSVISHPSFSHDHSFVGIWDCLSSQQVVDFVRYKVFEGKELTEIGEMLCDHCLAPDTSSGAGIGCDNMTVLIVAITHGRTKAEWYSWVADRVATGVGYSTPSSPPQLYATSRLASFRARREAQEARDRLHSQAADNPTPNGNDDLLKKYGLTVTTISSSGGISYKPGGDIVSDTGTLMFTNEDSDDDDSGDEGQSGRSFFTESIGLGRSESPDPTKSLKAQLDEFEKGIQDEDVDKDGDTQMEGGLAVASTPSSTKASALQGEAPPPALPNGDVTSPPVQHKTLPSGDAPLPVASVEGLLDKSEDPLKA